MYKNKTGEIKPIDLALPSITLGRNDAIRIFLKPVSNAFIYLLHYDSEQELELLFPPSFDFFVQHPKEGNGYTGREGFYLPGKSGWYEFVNNGTEELYLLVSSERLRMLEKLTHDLLVLPDKTGTKAGSVKQAVLDEIRRLKKEKSIFAGAVEKPVVIAGDYRGKDGTVEAFIKEIEAEGFYAKTIRIEH
jgi:hypothetical protein